LCKCDAGGSLHIRVKSMQKLLFKSLLMTVPIWVLKLLT